MSKRILVVDYKSKYSKDISKILNHIKVEYEFVSPLEIVNRIDDTVGGIILTGGKDHVYDNGAPLIDKLALEKNIPILGICYGLQVVMTIYEGHIMKMPKKHKGLEKITILEENPIVTGFDKFGLFMFNHQDSCDVIPPNFRSIANTDYCPAIIIHETLPIYLVQFHPEAKESSNGDKIFKNFIRICNL